MSSDLRRLLRRIKPEKRIGQLKRRSRSELFAAQRLFVLPAKLLYDTTVYIDVLQGRFPGHLEFLLHAAEAWHSTVTESELVAICGLLDPAHRHSRRVMEELIEVIERWPAHRITAPDREIWCEAGVLAGVLARLQGYSPGDRRRVLNDALLFSTARKHELTVLTRNLQDFDFLQQLVPAVQVFFYTV